jgi:ubiquinone/menaquinone biosynthesis C-methylase UbiE
VAESPRQRRTVRAEFERQAEAFAGAASLRAEELTAPVARALGRAARVLDVACGPGVLMPSLLPCADTVVGLDLTVATLRLARGRAECAGAAFACGPAERAPFADGAFDAAVLRLALHHMEQPAAVLGEVARLLAPGGRLVILDILGADDPQTARLHDAVERLRDPSHTRALASAELRDALAGAGLALESHEAWTSPREFTEWARIISNPVRMDALEQVLRALARAGERAGMELREDDGALRLSYRWGLWVARAPS